MHKTQRIVRALKTLSPPKAYYSQRSTTIEAQYAPDWNDALPYAHIPGPKPLPVVGNIWRFIPRIGELGEMDQISQHDYLNKTYGDIVRISGLLLRKDIVILFSPNDFRQVFRNEGVWPRRESLFSYVYYKQKVRSDVFQNSVGVLVGQGKTWHDTRTIVNPILMQPRNIRTYIGTMNEVSEDMVKMVRLLSSNPDRQLPEDFSNEIHKWALESVCVVALNKRLDLLNPNIKNPEALQFINDVLDMFLMLEVLEIKLSAWKWISTPAWRRFVKILNRMTDFQMKHLNDTIDTLGNKKMDNEQMSVIEKLLLIDKKIAYTMTYDMLVAGVDTTSRIVSAALYYLATNPEKQERLREELIRVLPRPDTPITHDVLEKSRYLRAVIKETTRLAPISIGTLRQAPKNLVLSGYQIPKGTDLLTSNMLLCRKDMYFSNAKSFIPERWLRDSRIQNDNLSSWVFQPFGFGPRSCIGKRLANLEIECFIAKMFRNFQFEWPNPEMKWVMNMLYGVGSPLKFKVTPICT